MKRLLFLTLTIGLYTHTVQPADVDMCCLLDRQVGAAQETLLRKSMDEKVAQCRAAIESIGDDTIHATLVQLCRNLFNIGDSIQPAMPPLRCMTTFILGNSTPIFHSYGKSTYQGKSLLMANWLSGYSRGHLSIIDEYSRNPSSVHFGPLPPPPSLAAFSTDHLYGELYKMMSEDMKPTEVPGNLVVILSTMMGAAGATAGAVLLSFAEGLRASLGRPDCVETLPRLCHLLSALQKYMGPTLKKPSTQYTHLRMWFDGFCQSYTDFRRFRISIARITAGTQTRGDAPHISSPPPPLFTINGQLVSPMAAKEAHRRADMVAKEAEQKAHHFAGRAVGNALGLDDIQNARHTLEWKRTPPPPQTVHLTEYIAIQKSLEREETPPLLQPIEQAIAGVYEKKKAMGASETEEYIPWLVHVLFDHYVCYVKEYGVMTALNFIDPLLHFAGDISFLMKREGSPSEYTIYTFFKLCSLLKRDITETSKRSHYSPAKVAFVDNLIAWLDGFHKAYAAHAISYATLVNKYHEAKITPWMTSEKRGSTAVQEYFKMARAIPTISGQDYDAVVIPKPQLVAIPCPPPSAAPMTSAGVLPSRPYSAPAGPPSAAGEPSTAAAPVATVKPRTRVQKKRDRKKANARRRAAEECAGTPSTEI